MNIEKSSSSFSRNLTVAKRAEIIQIMGFQEVTDHCRYLGFPSTVSRNVTLTFSYIKERVWSTISTWEAKSLSQAGKMVLLKAMASTISTYVMGVAYLSDSTCNSIERMMNAFFWSSRSDKKGMKWLSWKRMAYPKIRGGLGFRSMREFNLALLAKQGWQLLTNQSSLSYRVLKARYFPDSDFLNASVSQNDFLSYTWRSITKAQHLIREGCRKRIGNGSSTLIWSGAWLTSEPHLVPFLPPRLRKDTKLVSDLIDLVTTSWKEELLESLFPVSTVEDILSIPLSNE